MIEQLIFWYFIEVPRKIKKIWVNYLWFFAKYFALRDLIRDFFAPWKGLTFAREKRAFELGDIFSAWFGNVISCTIGAVMRLFFVLIGGAVELLALLAGPVVFLGWLAYIPAIFYFMMAGLRLLL